MRNELSVLLRTASENDFSADRDFLKKNLPKLAEAGLETVQSDGDKIYLHGSFGVLTDDAFEKAFSSLYGKSDRREDYMEELVSAEKASGLRVNIPMIETPPNTVYFVGKKDRVPFLRMEHSFNSIGHGRKAWQKAEIDASQVEAAVDFLAELIPRIPEYRELITLR